MRKHVRKKKHNLKRHSRKSELHNKKKQNEKLNTNAIVASLEGFLGYKKAALYGFSRKI